MKVDEIRLVWLAGRRRGIVTGEELAAAGMNADAIHHRLGKARLERVFRGVYLVGPGPPDLEQCEIAAVLAYGPDTALGVESAARRWRLPVPQPAHIHIITSRPRRPRDGVRPHHLTLLARHDVRHHRGLVITSPARTVLDLAPRLTATELERAVAEAIGTKLTTRRELERAAERNPTHRGAGPLRVALQADPGYTHEGAERKLLALVRAAKLPIPETNVMLHGYEVDTLWREPRLIVEVDSYAHHAQRPKFERDRVRDADLLAKGYRTLRLTWRALEREPYAAIARVASALPNPS
jgi:very-short-patch-repair endonuclease